MTDQPVDTKPCPYCGETIKASAIICRFCNRAMPGHESEAPAPAVTLPVAEKPRASKGLITGLVIILLLSAAGAAFYFLGGQKLLLQLQPCHIQAQEFTSQVGSYYSEWDDAATLALSTSRISLSPIVKDMQAIRKNVNNLDAPACAVKVKTLFVDYMDGVIDGYISFMSNDDDNVVSDKLSAAGDIGLEFANEYVKLKSGAAPYDR